MAGREDRVDAQPDPRLGTVSRGVDVGAVRVADHENVNVMRYVAGDARMAGKMRLRSRACVSVRKIGATGGASLRILR